MRGRGTRWLIGLVVAACLAVVTPGALADAGPQPAHGALTRGSVVQGLTEFPYLLYTPAPRRAERLAPLVVVVHGCQTTAQQQMRSSGFNQLADREGFVVLYPDVDAIGEALPGPANHCWKFPYPLAWSRGGSDAAAITKMTRAVTRAGGIDPERVYIVGSSAGGLMASIEAAAYPDVYAAVGIVAAGGYVDWPCFVTGVGIPVELSAQLAHIEMGERARVVPRIAIGGTADQAFPFSCVDKAMQQGLRTNNLVLSGHQDRPLSLAPSGVRTRTVPGGLTYRVSSYTGRAGCLVGELWRIGGLAHSWPGGATVPADQYNNDTRAPDGAQAVWEFFRRHTRSDACR